MSRNSGQNIDDMLKELKASVAAESKGGSDELLSDKGAAAVEISDDDLQNQLRSQFLTGDSPATTNDLKRLRFVSIANESISFILNNCPFLVSNRFFSFYGKSNLSPFFFFFKSESIFLL